MKLKVPEINNSGSSDPRLAPRFSQDGLSRKNPMNVGVRATSRDSIKEPGSRRDARKEAAGLARRFWRD